MGNICRIQGRVIWKLNYKSHVISMAAFLSIRTRSCKIIDSQEHLQEPTWRLYVIVGWYPHSGREIPLAHVIVRGDLAPSFCHGSLGRKKAHRIIVNGPKNTMFGSKEGEKNGEENLKQLENYTFLLFGLQNECDSK